VLKPWLLLLLFGLAPQMPVWVQAIDGATPSRFLRIGKEQGLTGIKPTCVFQDSYGFVWIGTWGGLYRFDGYTCKHFEHIPGDSNSLPDNFIAYHAFFEDKNTDIWFPTFNSGFVRFDRKTERFQSFRTGENRLAMDALNALCGDLNGDIWLGTRGLGLSRYICERDSFINYRPEGIGKDTLKGNRYLLSVFPSRDGLIWFGTQEGLAFLNPATGEFKYFYPGVDGHIGAGLSYKYVSDIFQDKKNQIWVCTRKGLNKFVPPDTFVHYFPSQHLTVPNKSAYDYIHRVLQDSLSGDYWVGTEAGLLRFDPEKGTFEPIPHNPLDRNSVSEGGVHGIYEDRRGNIWVSADGGLSLLDKKATRLQGNNWPEVQKLLPSLSILNEGPHVLQTGERIWLASEKGLCTFLPGETIHQFEKLGKGFTALFADTKGRLFAGTSRDTFFVINTKNLQLIDRLVKAKSTNNAQNPTGARNTAFAEDRNGAIWMGSLGALNRKDPLTGQYMQFGTAPANDRSLSNPDITDLHTDRNGNLWIATMRGVNMLSAQELNKAAQNMGDLSFVRHQFYIDSANSISNNHVRVIFEDRQGQMWFGTDAGLNLFDPKKQQWQRFFKKDGLPEDKITGLLEDKDGAIWATSESRGIAKYTQGRFLWLTQSNGLNAEYYPTNSCLALKDGRLLFAGIGGLNVFDPQMLKLEYDTFPMYIVKTSLFNQALKPGGADSILKQADYLTSEIELDYDQKVISFQVAALNFTNPEKQVYRYRLEGFPSLENWQPLGNGREITLTNLFPRTYTLYVESSTVSDDREHWECAIQPLTIHVRYPWGSILLFSIAIFGTLYIVYKLRVRRKLAAAEARRLQELDHFKTKFFTNISHEFRTPLTVILGEAEQLDKEALNYQHSGLAAIRRQGRHLLNLLNQILDLAKVEAGSMRLNYVQSDVLLYLKYLLESFHSLAEDKKIQLHFEADAEKCWMDYTPNGLQTIVSNLLSNAIKFTPNGGRVALEAVMKEQPGKFILRISDTGIGIGPEKIPFVFDRYYQAGEESGGTGIGLALVKEFVALMGGFVIVESTLGIGTTFTVTLPLTHKAAKRHFPVEGFGEKNETFKPENQDFSITPKTSHPQETLLPLLLLVEDNPDVSRYISSLLVDEYRIHLAQNGKEGLEAGLRLVPDLIISDVMMPEMDGYTFCRALKNDLRSSHIPVILLTAKADLDARLAGLEEGADAYLTKPFEERELRVELRKLHELRKAMRARYSDGFAATAPSDNPAFRREDAFLKKMHEVLEANYSAEDFGVPEMCAQLEMTQPVLYRKLTSLQDKNIEDYLRSFRLDKARLLLRDTDLSVKEVAFACGFREPAHFTRVFKQEFGFPPSQLRK
jgi:signal transduction histidine kinase/ligand-binding sensor domain-containing protein/CheY-like chemotaxis protein